VFVRSFHDRLPTRCGCVCVLDCFDFVFLLPSDRQTWVSCFHFVAANSDRRKFAEFKISKENNILLATCQRQ
jgi:hypothetical protein